MKNQRQDAAYRIGSARRGKLNSDPDFFSLPWAAARAVAGGAERSVANSVDTAQGLSQSSRLLADRAMKPLQNAVSANTKDLSRRA